MKRLFDGRIVRRLTLSTALIAGSAAHAQMDPTYTFTPTDIYDDSGTLIATPVQIDAEHFYYELQGPALSTPDRVLAGGTWTYVGQKIYTYDYTFSGKGVSDESEEYPGETEADRIAYMRSSYERIDRLGRRWAWVGPNAQAQADADADALEENNALATIQGTDPVQAVLEPWVTTAEAVTPISWNKTDCFVGFDDNGDPVDAPHYVWGGDSRVQVSTFGIAARKAAVLIDTGAGKCSGTLAGENYVLTAAHCLVDDNGNELPEVPMKVCTRGNLSTDPNVECTTVFDFHINEQYLIGAASTHEDYAVMILDAPTDGVLGDGSEYAISQASPSFWDNFQTRTIGYPGFEPGSTPPSCTRTSTFSSPGVELRRQERSDFGHSTKMIRTKFDAAAGQSGSAIYYCPVGNENCNKPFVIGVMANFGTFYQRFQGPRSRSIFRQFIIDNE